MHTHNPTRPTNLPTHVIQSSKPVQIAQFPTPPPCSATSCLSSLSTFRLNSLRSSGLITRSSVFSSDSRRVLGFAARFGHCGGGSDPVDEDAPCDGESSAAVLRRRSCFGSGKFDFLSTASTVRWKRRNNISARMRVELRSIVFESSFTV